MKKERKESPTISCYTSPHNLLEIACTHELRTGGGKGKEERRETEEPSRRHSKEVGIRYIERMSHLLYGERDLRTDVRFPSWHQYARKGKAAIRKLCFLISGRS